MALSSTLRVFVQHGRPKTTVCFSCLKSLTGDFAPDFANQNLKFVRLLGSRSEIDKNVADFKKGDFSKVPNPNRLEHFRTQLEDSKGDVKTGYNLPHPIWSETEVDSVEITHRKPDGFVDNLAYYAIQAVRSAFDLLSGFTIGKRSETKWIRRIVFLETVAGVPGMVGAMLRHLHSLRRMRRDYGWIHTLLEEAENERMHLMTALQVQQPSWFFRICVLITQGVFVNMFSVCYLISPRFCHRFVGYLEEEAVKTYTNCLEDINGGVLNHWNTKPAPEIAITYWKLGDEATMHDVILAIRADEAQHRTVNHTLATLKPDDFNPYKPGK